MVYIKKAFKKSKNLYHVRLDRESSLILQFETMSLARTHATFRSSLPMPMQQQSKAMKTVMVTQKTRNRPNTHQLTSQTNIETIDLKQSNTVILNKIRIKGFFDKGNFPLILTFNLDYPFRQFWRIADLIQFWELSTHPYKRMRIS